MGGRATGTPRTLGAARLIAAFVCLAACPGAPPPAPTPPASPAVTGARVSVTAADAAAPAHDEAPPTAAVDELVTLVGEDEVQPPDPTDAADDEVAEAHELDRILCHKRGCCVSKVEDAGRDRRGYALAVATVDVSGGVCLAPPQQQPEPFGRGVLDREPSPFHRRQVEADAAPAGEAGQADEERRASQVGEAGGEEPASDPRLDPDGEQEEASEGGDCRPFEFHLVVRDKGKVKTRQLLSQACNDGHGTAGVGEDLIEVDAAARTFTHTQSGGSAWRGDHSITVGLDPLRIARVETSSYWAGDADGSWQSTEWSWDLFSGDKAWPVADCTAPPRPHRSATGGGRPSDAEVPGAHKKIRGVLVPRVALPAAFVRDGWRTMSPGPCAILVDGAGHGFVVHGGPGRAADASMRVVLSREDVLFVEITDDRWVDSAPSWVKEDHVEVWLGDPRVGGYSQQCAAGPASARQWGIRVSDGAVFQGIGAPAGLSGVESVRTGRVARLKIPLGVERASGLGRLTVAYSDSDDGSRQERVFATSQVERGRGETLSDVWDVDPAQATCIEKGKALAVARAPLRPKRNQPVGQP